jgi:hypothetical protein
LDTFKVEKREDTKWKYFEQLLSLKREAFLVDKKEKFPFLWSGVWPLDFPINVSCE